MVATCRAELARRLPPRCSLCRFVRPLDAGIGATPHSRAKAASDRRRSGLSPIAIRRVTAVSGPSEHACRGRGDLLKQRIELPFQHPAFLDQGSSSKSDRLQGELGGLDRVIQARGVWPEASSDVHDLDRSGSKWEEFANLLRCGDDETLHARRGCRLGLCGAFSGHVEPTRTPTACCASTSPRAPTCRAGPPKISRRSHIHSTTGPARSSAGGPPPKSSKTNYAHFNNPVLQRPVELAQYLSIAYTARFVDTGLVASVGSVGDSYDAAAETLFGLFKTEVIRARGPWKSIGDVELATCIGSTGTTTSVCTATAATSLRWSTKPSFTTVSTTTGNRSAQQHKVATEPGAVQSMTPLPRAQRAVG